MPPMVTTMRDAPNERGLEHVLAGKWMQHVQRVALLQLLSDVVVVVLV